MRSSRRGRPIRIDGATRSTTSARNTGITPSSSAFRAALRPAAVVAQHDDEGGTLSTVTANSMEAQHCRVDGLPGGADHEHVTQALIEDELAATRLSAQPNKTAVGF